MTKVLERLTQQVYATKWADLEKLDKKYDAIESRLGFPSKRRYRLFAGGGGTNTLVIEREWDSLADLEATYEKAFNDPEWQAVDAEAPQIIADNQFELLMPL
jgi:hypothetical protein